MRETRADHADAVSVVSLESERRQSLAESVDNRSLEIYRNQVIYSNLRNGNPCQQNIHHPGYFTPPPTALSKFIYLICPYNFYFFFQNFFHFFDFFFLF